MKRLLRMLKRVARLAKPRKLWRIIRLAVTVSSKVGHLLAVSLEILFHVRFGERYWLKMSCALALCYGYVALAPHFWNGKRTLFLQLFFWTLAMLCACQWLSMLVRWRNGLEIHSLSRGTSWGVWEKLPVRREFVERYCEPSLALFMGLFIGGYDPALGLWLKAAVGSLFIKCQLGRHRSRARTLDALDSRIEGKQLQRSIAQRTTAQSTSSGSPHTVEASAVEVGTPSRGTADQFDELDPEIKRLMNSGKEQL